MISIDGLHALDVANYVDSHPRSTIASLAAHGVTYTNASTPFNSDSFPGLLALVTGGSPVSTGVFYDVSYDRSAFAPDNRDCSGAAGNTITFDESVDRYTVDASGKHVSQDVIDPLALPRARDATGRCGPLFPHDFLRVNTIFEVVRIHGGRTAWADKHPVYDIVNGPSGKGVDDLYTPEVTHTQGYDSRGSVVCTAENDMLKVRAVVNQIHGMTHDGRNRARVPTLFGMNFQAVSVAQKLTAEEPGADCDAGDEALLKGKAGGYLDGVGTPGTLLQYGFDRTDKALGDLVDALKAENLYASTLIVLTAKHGQSPVDPGMVSKPGSLAKLVAALPDAGSSTAAAAIATAANCHSGPCGFVSDDDIAMVWLPDQTKTADVARYLEGNAKSLHVAYVLAGNSLRLRMNDPARDPRVPDLVVVPNYGVIFSDSKSKIAEHGGLSPTDTNVALVLSNPGMHAGVIKTPVLSSQVAPTILKVLGIGPESLDAVREEDTVPLPMRATRTNR